MQALRLISTARFTVRHVALFLWPLLAALLIASGGMAQARAAPPAYRVAIVVGHGGADAINEAGELAGFVRGFDINARGFLYTGGNLTVLGTMGGYASQATGLNNHGQASGSYSIWETGARAFSYANGNMSNLGTLGGNYSVGNDINDSGTVVGMAARTDGQFRAFRYQNGSMQDLGTMSGAARSHSLALAINNAGQIVGRSSVGNLDANEAPSHAFLYQDGAMHDLGTLGGGFYSEGIGINDRGDVVGLSQLSPANGGGTHAFLYRDGVMSDLGALAEGNYAYARDINNHGLIVGNSITPGNEHGFIYSAGMLIDLNNVIDRSTGWEILGAGGINDRNQIAATACRDNDCYAVRLDLLSDALPVPEPASYAMLLAGLVIVGMRGRKKNPRERGKEKSRRLPR